MFVLKNAWAQLMRHKWRTLLTTLIALLVAFGALFGLALQQANDTAATDYDALAPASVVRMTAKQSAQYDGADVSWVKHYLTTSNYNDYYSIVTEQSITLSNVNASMSVPVRQTKDSVQAIAGTDDQDADKTGGEFTLKAFTSVQTARDNELGRYTVVKGKHLSYSGKAPKGALISQTLADKNNLKVGDEITVASPSDASKTVKLTVRGIYTYNDATAPAGKGSDAKLAKDNRDNAIYVSYATLYESGITNEEATDWSKPDLSYVFEFSSMSDYNKYKAKAAKKVADGYEIDSPTIDAYEAKVAPLKTLVSRVGVATTVVLPIVGGVLLLVLVLLGVTRRSNEIGMALVSGVTRGRMGWQFMVEVLLPTLVGLAIGLLAGGLGAKPLGAALTGGYSTPMTAAIMWRVVGVGVAVAVVLAIVAAIRVACFGNAALFRSRETTAAPSVDPQDSTDTTDDTSDTVSDHAQQEA